MRTTLSWLTALVFAAFSLQTLAATKQFSLTMSAISPNMTATINNLATGNSYVNSIRLTPAFDVTGVTIPPNIRTNNTTVSPTCTTSSPCAAGTPISISYITGVGPGSSAAIGLSVIAPTGIQVCTASYQWSAQAWTGNTFGGTSYYSGASTTATASTPISCALQFLTQPANAQVGATITDSSSNPVKVELLAGGTLATWFTGQIALANAGPGTGTLSGGDAVSAVGGVASFNSLSLSAVGTYSLTASSSGFTSVNSNPFTIYDGKLDCNPNPPFSFRDLTVNVTDSTQSGYAEGSRGYWNKDGLDCVPILYTFTNTILTDNTVHLAWDTSTSQHPAFTYTMTWKTEDVANPNNPANNTVSSTYGWPVPKRPYVAWQTSDGTASGTPQYVPALTCVSTDLPAPYAALAADIPLAASGSQSLVTVSVPPSVPTYFDNVTQTTKSYPTSTLPTTASTSSPFPIVIDTERMKVVGVTAAGTGQYTLTVVRGDGGTTPAAHTAGGYVMSTPLPIDSNPSSAYYKQQVPMCVVNHGWMAAGIDPTNGIPQIRYFTTVYDIGDGFVTIR